MIASLIKRRKIMARIYYLLNEKYYGFLRAIFTCGLWIQGGLWSNITIRQGK